MIPISKPYITRKERRAVNRVLKSGNLAQGPEVEAFEFEFSRVVGNRVCVAVNSGTSGLLLSLLASGIGKGDEVIVPSFTFAATANSVMLAGAKPIFVDVDLHTFNILPEAIESAITPNTKAIQPVHLYGLPANMPEIMKIAEKRGLIVFEDAAQAHLASISQTPVGNFGLAATFSFYPTKNMTSGEGGMIVCESSELARTCRLLRNQGMETRYQNEIVGFNVRMTDIHAAIGRVQLRKLAEWTRKRQANARFLSQNIKGVVVPNTPEGFSHVYHQYTIRIVDLDRDKFAEQLFKRGVASGVYYPKPVHTLKPFLIGKDLENTKIACEQVLSLPVNPLLTSRDLEKIVTAVNEIARAGA